MLTFFFPEVHKDEEDDMMKKLKERKGRIYELFFGRAEEL